MPDYSLPDLERVTLRRRIGRGGMADVYLGHHTTLSRPVAVKILHAHLVEEQGLKRRFQAEARAVANLRHPNIVQVYDFGILDGRPYIVMEYVDGPPLAAYLSERWRKGEGIQLWEAGRIISEIAAALDYAHARGIVHRDVKPANILLRPSGPAAELVDSVQPSFEAVLSDFGVARVAQSTAATLSGMILGTPAYMGPEQVTGEQIDARTDIYSLGVVLYEMVTGRLPYLALAETPAAVMFKHVHETPAPLPPKLNPLQPVVNKALAKVPGARYGTAGSLAEDVRTVADGGVSNAALAPQRENRKTSSGQRTRRSAILAIAATALVVLSAFGLPRVLPNLRGPADGTAIGVGGTLPPTDTPEPSVTATAPAGSTGADSGGTPPLSPASQTQSSSSTASRVAGPATGDPSPSETMTHTATATQTASVTATPSANPTSAPTGTPPPTPTPTLTPTTTPIITIPTLDLLD